MPEHTGPTLTVDLSALAANYRTLREHFSGKECGAVVKANAYGLGVSEVAKTLQNSGCKIFFVATLEEGIELRGILPETAVYVFHGPYAGEEKEYAQYTLRPVINSMEQLKRWNGAAPFALHVDTGMNRLGLTQAELEALHPSPVTRHPSLLMSHMACANEPEHPLNTDQLARFRRAHALLPDVPVSLCNSSGIFLGQDFHFDLARPGCALYGVNPTDKANPMRPVATLSAPLLQIRTIAHDGSVGYGATCNVKKNVRIAIVQLGYADGYLRSLSNRSEAFVGGQRVPILGRVSMDMIALDMSSVPETAVSPQARAEFMNAEITVDDIAYEAGTIGYEVLTRIGARVKRLYV